MELFKGTKQTTSVFNRRGFNKDHFFSTPSVFSVLIVSSRLLERMPKILKIKTSSRGEKRKEYDIAATQSILLTKYRACVGNGTGICLIGTSYFHSNDPAIDLVRNFGTPHWREN